MHRLAGIFQGTKQDTMLQILLQMTLYLTVRHTYLARQTAHFSYISFTEQQCDRHDKNQHNGQTHIQIRKEIQSTQQLETRDKHRRQHPAQCIGYGLHILLQTIQHISGMQLLPSRPAALHQMHKKLAVQFIP